MTQQFNERAGANSFVTADNRQYIEKQYFITHSAYKLLLKIRLYRKNDTTMEEDMHRVSCYLEDAENTDKPFIESIPFENYTYIRTKPSGNQLVTVFGFLQEFFTRFDSVWTRIIIPLVGLLSALLIGVYSSEHIKTFIARILQSVGIL